MKELLLQIKQRTEKLIEEVDKLADLEFDYHTMCTTTDYSIIQDQKDLVEFLKMKLNSSVLLLGDDK
jgi:hypothetical protein